MFFLVPDLVEEQDAGISALENSMCLVVFLTIALLQWFAISLSSSRLVPTLIH